ncbi:MAG: sialate O-acetylesterase [Verrucomicrobiae bacterium]|nr:sialate O-acetylesterase [Verrucomicrobiae bacterium]NNJ86438.1 sialate O-acetylesterase [Akkermansiaceae bacterium]
MKFHRFCFVLYSILMATQLFAVAQPDGPVVDKSLHVYLLIGQSNMAGRAPFSAEEAKPIKNCYLLNAKDLWEEATNPLNRYSTIRKGLQMQKLNPGYGFAQTMLDQRPGISIGLVVNAKGGTKIGQWKKGTKFYQEAVRRAKEAQKHGKLKGILWHQGESDNGKPEGYLDAMKQLVANLRKDLGVKDLPIVVGQVREGSAINEILASVPKKIPHTACVSSKGLKTMDRWHFDARSMKELGKRYAEAMLKLQQ